jgi:hypothetical protein
MYYLCAPSSGPTNQDVDGISQGWLLGWGIGRYQCPGIYFGTIRPLNFVCGWSTSPDQAVFAKEPGEILKRQGLVSREIRIAVDQKNRLLNLNYEYATNEL